MPISISAIMSSFNKNIDSFTVVRILKNYLGEEKAKIQYGILSGKVDTLCALPLSINIALVTALVPTITRDYAKGKTESLQKKTKIFILITVLIGLPCTVGMILFAKPILNMLFPNANSGSVLLQISSIAIIFTLLTQTINGILQSIGKVEIPAIAFTIGMILKFITNIVLMNNKKFGINGAAIGNIVCNITVFIIGFISIKRNIKLNFSFSKIIFKPCIATFFMGIVLMYSYKALNKIILGNYATILAILIAVVVYLLCIIILRVFSKEELKMLKNLKAQ